MCTLYLWWVLLIHPIKCWLKSLDQWDIGSEEGWREATIYHYYSSVDRVIMESHKKILVLSQRIGSRFLMSVIMLCQYKKAAILSKYNSLVANYTPVNNVILQILKNGLFTVDALKTVWQGHLHTDIRGRFKTIWNVQVRCIQSIPTNLNLTINKTMFCGIPHWVFPTLMKSYLKMGSYFYAENGIQITTSICYLLQLRHFAFRINSHFIH